MSFTPQLIYLTCPDLDVARNIVRHLLHLKLIACGNILPTHESHYIWNNDIESSTEHLVILKSSQACFKQIEQEIVQLHPYDTPCILSLPIDKGHSPFLKWLQASVELK